MSPPPSAPNSPVGLVLDPLFAEHDPGPGHPEQVARYTAITQTLETSGIAAACHRIEPRAATRQELLLVHEAHYLDLVEQETGAGATQLSTGDTHLGPRSREVALQAAGAVCRATEAVFEGEVNRAFCALRPPGHHATANRGMGFCIFNNIALAARYAQDRGFARRVAIVDWDVHHGNGTQDIFYRDHSVHFFSTHQSPLYPGTGAAEETGEGAGKGTTLNRPFPRGSGFQEIHTAFSREWVPAMEVFQPDLVLISAGFDSRIDDPLGGFTLTDDDFAALTGLIREIAQRFADGRIISCLEGGYNVPGLASAVEAHCRALLK